MHYNNLKIVEANRTGPIALWNFFLKVKDEKYFQPHPFDCQTAFKLYFEETDNLYYVLVSNKILAYGFVRGWDEDWEDKCLGICVAPEERGKGYGELLTRFLWSAAKARGVERLRLHVDRDNEKARKLYEKLGYEFVGEREDGELIGYKNGNKNNISR